MGKQWGAKKFKSRLFLNRSNGAPINVSCLGAPLAAQAVYNCLLGAPLARPASRLPGAVSDRAPGGARVIEQRSRQRGEKCHFY